MNFADTNWLASVYIEAQAPGAVEALKLDHESRQELGFSTIGAAAHVVVRCPLRRARAWTRSVRDGLKLTALGEVL